MDESLASLASLASTNVWIWHSCYGHHAAVYNAKACQTRFSGKVNGTASLMIGLMAIDESAGFRNEM